MNFYTIYNSSNVKKLVEQQTGKTLILSGVIFSLDVKMRLQTVTAQGLSPLSLFLFLFKVHEYVNNQHELNLKAIEGL